MCCIFNILGKWYFILKNKKKKILIFNKFYVLFNLVLLKKEFMLKSIIYVG